MLVNRVVNYIQNNLNCTEVTGVRIVRPYRSFAIPGSAEKFFVTDNMVFIGETFMKCRPARSIIENSVLN